MKQLLIVWHSRTGAARQMAEAAARGAQSAAAQLEQEADLRVALRRASDTEAEDLLASQGYLFCAPENLAGLSGEMKEFFDRNYYAVLDRIQGLPYACAISAGRRRWRPRSSSTWARKRRNRSWRPRRWRKRTWRNARNWGDCWRGRCCWGSEGERRWGERYRCLTPEETDFAMRHRRAGV
jgi:hypothetical protein